MLDLILCPHVISDNSCIFCFSFLFTMVNKDFDLLVIKIFMKIYCHVSFKVYLPKLQISAS